MAFGYAHFVNPVLHSMKTIGSCSVCGGPVQVPEETSAEKPSVPTCSQCGATAANDHGPVLKMNPQPADSSDDIQGVLASTVNRWCPAKEGSIEERMALALLRVNAYEIDFRRAEAGGTILGGVYPLPLPQKKERANTV